MITPAEGSNAKIEEDRVDDGSLAWTEIALEGPFSSPILADPGANMTEVEIPGSITRDASGLRPCKGEGGHSTLTNRNKHGPNTGLLRSDAIHGRT